MKRHYMIMSLGLYVFLMGIVGLIRSGSVLPVLITGGIALITLAIARLVQRGSRAALVAAAIWSAVNALVFMYMAVVPVSAHSPLRAGSEYIFGSMAAVAVLVFFGITGALRQRHVPPDL